VQNKVVADRMLAGLFFRHSVYDWS